MSGILPFCASIIVGIFAGNLQLHADVWTGKVQAISGPTTPCSVPPASPPRVSIFQLNSVFQYSSCKEYRRPDTSVYYSLEPSEDGEYIRMIARPGEMNINPADYLTGASSAVLTCEQIRADVLRDAIAAPESSCADQDSAN